jgi:RND family efflux transporter MFP subunit
MKQTLLRMLPIAAILALAVAASWALAEFRPDPPMRETVSLDPLVHVLEPVPKTTRFQLRSQGLVRPVTETALSAEVSGSIVEVSPGFVAGGRFAAGEVLLRIDPTDYQVAVDQAEALVHQRQIEFNALSRLRDQGYGSETEQASAAAALASAEAELVRARRNLERTEIRVPYAGLVRSQSADLGEYVAPGSPLGVVFSTAAAEVRLPVSDEDLAFLNLPDPETTTTSADAAAAEVTLTATRKGQLRAWTAAIVREEGVIDENSRMSYVVARIEDPYRQHAPGEPLSVGSFVSASIEGIAVHDLVRVPRSALRRSNEILLVDADERLDIATVHVVRNEPEFVYLHAGDLPPGRIVVTPLESPVDNMKLRVSVAHSDDFVARK